MLVNQAYGILNEVNLRRHLQVCVFCNWTCILHQLRQYVRFEMLYIYFRHYSVAENEEEFLFLRWFGILIVKRLPYLIYDLISHQWAGNVRCENANKFQSNKANLVSSYGYLLYGFVQYALAELVHHEVWHFLLLRILAYQCFSDLFIEQFYFSPVFQWPLHQGVF